MEKIRQTCFVFDDLFYSRINDVTGIPPPPPVEVLAADDQTLPHRLNVGCSDEREPIRKLLLIGCQDFPKGVGIPVTSLTLYGLRVRHYCG